MDGLLLLLLPFTMMQSIRVQREPMMLSSIRRRTTRQMMVRMILRMAAVAAALLMLGSRSVASTRYGIHYRPPPISPYFNPSPAAAAAAAGAAAGAAAAGAAAAAASSALAVQGVTLCQQCSLVGTSSLAFSRPLQGAMVQLVCRDYRYKAFISMVTTTDSRGYFLFRLRTFDFSKYDPIRTCRAFIVSSRDANCNAFSNVNSGRWGAQLRKEAIKLQGAVLYSVGPFAFTPSSFTCKKSP